ncbi:MAG: hypothetical protein VYD82_04905 [Candidatus Thermoplasmatota archaeon]|nr:hypothetical protein [Candidatus Thermoplasmatota archaeon]MED5455676.1 hypothetical protein [Candidatus Thermoplasmatota archaeon]
MVDVDSALRASAYSGKKRPKGSDSKKEEVKSRKIEPFEPGEAFEKEKADAFSMWLVIVFGLTMGLIMRYAVMPTLSQSEAILWVLPLSLVVILPTMHKLLIPNKWSDRYDGGNWFRASFLYIFSWLAISFLLVNPPLADIAPPTLANGIDVQNTDSIEYAGMIDGTYTIALNQGTVDVVLGMAVRDNVDAENATVQVSFWKYGALVGELANGTASDLTEARATFESVNNSWVSVDNLGNPVVIKHSEDIGLAWDLGSLTPGQYEIKVRLSEVGDPWDENVWERTYSIAVVTVATA